MVKDCMENDHGFVIVFQKELPGGDYEISKKGSYVEIIDFNNLSNGLLGITVKCMSSTLGCFTISASKTSQSRRHAN